MPDFFCLIDANLNRVAEGLRVLEDYYRFAAVNQALAARCKAMRHRLRHEPARLAPDLCALLPVRRKVESDPGRSVTRQLQTEGAVTSHHVCCQDLLAANCKRIQEGLRTLEEASRCLRQSDLALLFEDLRYEAYQLETCCLTFGTEKKSLAPSHPPLAQALQGLYGIVSPGRTGGRSPLEIANLLLSAGVTALQYRNKEASTATLLADGLQLATACRQAGALLIINDRIDVALACGADGVQLGQDDLPIETARSMAAACRPGSPFLIGISTHNPIQAQAAVEAGCDYIGVGPVFTSRTKIDSRTSPAGLDFVRWAADHIPVPQVAIGGISLEVLPQVLAAGATCCAAIAAIQEADDVFRSASQIHQTILAGRPQT
jgi:thiamine-phosphate pyrophosphorylase